MIHRRPYLLLTLALALLIASEATTQDRSHVAIETTSLVLDQSRVERIGVDGIVLSAPDVTVRGGHPGGIRVGTRIGNVDVSAWLELVRRERAVQRETTQRLVVLSGSSAELTNQQTVIGPYGHAASAGPRMWVEPIAMEDGRVRLRIWSAVGEVRPGPFGSVVQEVPVEASTEVVVQSGTPLVIASTDISEQASDRGIASRGTSRNVGRTWIVVTARVVEDAADAFPMPDGIPAEWLE